AGPRLAEPLGDRPSLVHPEQDALARRAEREDAVHPALAEEPRQRLAGGLVHPRAAVAQRRHGGGEEQRSHLHTILDEKAPGRITLVETPPRTADLVVIGGGMVGAATAFYAPRAGIRSVLIEARPALCTLTTPVSTGAFRLQFSTEEELRLVEESVALFQSFAEVTGQRAYDPAIRAQGYLWMTRSPERAAEQRELVERQHGWGVTDIELLDGDEVRRRFPYVAADVLQARFRAGDGCINTRVV